MTLLGQDVTTGGLSGVPGSHKHHADIFKRWPQRRSHYFFMVPREDLVFAPQSHVVTAHAGDHIVWDSRCVHCNVPARYDLDEVSLEPALAKAGLSAASPMFSQLPNAADAARLFEAIGGSKPSGERRLRCEIARLGIQLDEEKFAELQKKLGEWSEQLANDIQQQGPQWDDAPRLTRPVAYVCAVPRHTASPEVLSERRLACLSGATTSHWPNKLVIGSDWSGLGCVDPLTMEGACAPARGVRRIGARNNASRYDATGSSLAERDSERGVWEPQGGAAISRCVKPQLRFLGSS